MEGENFQPNSIQTYCGTHVENFESSDIKHSDEMVSLLVGVEGLVNPLHEPLEQTVVHRLGQRADRGNNLLQVSALGNHLGADLYPGLQEILVKLRTLKSQQLSDAIAFLISVGLGLFLPRSLLELQTANLHHG